MSRKCLFLGADIQELKEIASDLQDLKIEPLLIRDYPSRGLSILSKFTRVAEDADFAIAVLEQEEPRPNVLFEIGYVMGMGIPLIVLGSPQAPAPSDLSGVLYLRSGPDNREALRFAIEQLRKAPKAKKKRKSSKSAPQTTRPIGPLADSLLHRLNEGNLDYRGVEDIVYAALRDGGVEVMVEGQADFAIWCSPLQPLLGNPILADVKLSQDSIAPVPFIGQRMADRLRKRKLRGGLVFHLGELPVSTRRDVFSNVLILFVDIHELLTELRHKSFVDIIWDIRNKAAHGIDL